VNTDIIDFTDFLPTLLEAADYSPPEPASIDGKSFFARIRGEIDDPREWIYCNYDPKWGRWKPGCFARDKHWKLYETGALFNLVSDPGESQPVSDGETNPEADAAREKLQAVLEQMRKPPARKPARQQERKKNPLSDVFK
jgi:arylsulfatase A-like enzyme